MSAIKQQINLMLIALTFLTRVPSPIEINFSQHNLNKASRYFSLIGYFVGVTTALIFWLCSQVLPTDIAIIISMILSFLLTGGFHEDGLADTCDGLGGGFERHQKLTIMKDSRIGTYGALGIWSILSFKFVLLSNLENVVLALVVAHPLSRSVSTVLIALLPYVQDAADSKSKPLAESQLGKDWMIALLIGLTSLMLLPNLWFFVVPTLVGFVFLARQFLKKQIGGFTGDALGAVQQVAEVLVYLVIIIGSQAL